MIVNLVKKLRSGCLLYSDNNLCEGSTSCLNYFRFTAIELYQHQLPEKNKPSGYLLFHLKRDNESVLDLKKVHHFLDLGHVHNDIRDYLVTMNHCLHTNNTLKQYLIFINEACKMQVIVISAFLIIALCRHRLMKYAHFRSRLVYRICLFSS